MRRKVRKITGLLILAALLVMIVVNRQWIMAKVEETFLQERDEGGNVIVPEALQEGLSGFAYEQVTEEQKLIYGQVLGGLQQYKDSFYVTAAESFDVQEAFFAVLTDHPELFWVDGVASFSAKESSRNWNVKTTFNMSAADIPAVQAQIEAVCDEFLQTISADASDYDKVKAAYEYVILNTDYSMDGVQNQNIQSVFVTHISVCAGYAKAFQYLLTRMGIPCSYITGTVWRNGGAAEEHAWNCVEIDGAFYLVDATWGDPTYGSEDEVDNAAISYDYLCLTTEELARSHTPSETYTVPICDSRKYDYYLLQNRYYEGYDADTISQVLWDSINNSEPSTEMKFSDYDSYNAAKTDIFREGGLIEAPARKKMEWDGITNYEYRYIYNDELYILKISW